MPGAAAFSLLEGKVKYLAATPRFKDVIQTFAVPAGETPAGFRIESTPRRTDFY